MFRVFGHDVRMRRLAAVFVILAACSSPTERPTADNPPADAPLNATRVDTPYGPVWSTEVMVYAHDCRTIQKLKRDGILRNYTVPPYDAEPGHVCG